MAGVGMAAEADAEGLGGTVEDGAGESGLLRVFMAGWGGGMGSDSSGNAEDTDEAVGEGERGVATLTTMP